jgi:predicted regulator of Ras-like GTPase activity (Roadblock/LC7/MglB family)
MSQEVVDIADVEAAIQRLSSYNGVKGVIVSNSEGVPIRITLSEPEETSKFSNLSARILHQGETHLKHANGHDSIGSIRIRGKKTEVVITSSMQGEYPLILSVIQALGE